MNTIIIGYLVTGLRVQIFVGERGIMALGTHIFSFDKLRLVDQYTYIFRLVTVLYVAVT